MNWKEEAVSKLKNYGAMRSSLENLPLELKQLELDARRIAGSDPGKVRVGGSVRSGEDALLSNLVHRQELELALQQAKCWVDSVDRALHALNGQEMTVLQRLYLQPERGGVDRLCQELAAERSTVYRRRDEALRRFTMAMYGRIDS